MQIAGRDTSTIVKSVLDRRHYIAARNMVRLYEHPADMFRRYLTGTGTYPTTVRVRTPIVVARTAPVHAARRAHGQ